MASIADRMANQDAASNKLFLVLFSPPNIGKTVLSSRIGDRNLILTDESGHFALKDFPELDAKTDTIPFEGLNDFRDILVSKRDGLIEADTLIVDTFTGIQRAVMESYMDEKLPNGQPNPNYLKVTRTHPKMPVLQDYNLAEFLWNPVFRLLAKQNLLNVIMNCHVRLPNPDKPTVGETTRPRIPDAVYQALNGKANVVAYMGKVKGQRYVQTIDPDGRIAGKTQIQMPPKVSDDDFVDRVRNWLSQ